MTKLTVKILLALLLATIPAQIAFGQKTAAQKKKLVGQLVEKTFKIYPIQGLTNGIREANEEISVKFKNETAADIAAKIDAYPNFSDERKSAAKAKIPELTDKLTERLKYLVTGDLNAELWLKDALKQNYTRRLTVADLKKTIAFLDTSGGIFFINIIKKESGEPETEGAETSPEFVKFSNSPTADKFLDSFLKDSSEILSAKVDAWSVNANKKLAADMQNGELKRLVTAFINENLK